MMSMNYIYNPLIEVNSTDVLLALFILVLRTKCEILFRSQPSSVNISKNDSFINKKKR